MSTVRSALDALWRPAIAATALFGAPRVKRKTRDAAPVERRLDVNFVPLWPKNPYHSELARHLASHRVAVGSASALKQIVATAKRTGHYPDIVHLHALPPFSLLPKRAARALGFWLRVLKLRRAGVKIVWTVHNISDHESIYPRIDRAFCRWCYRLADAVIIHTLAAREAVEAQWNVRRDRNVFIVHHGHFIDSYPATTCRSDARKRLNLPESALVFLFLGNIRPYKGVPQLVQVFKSIATPAMRLVIAGEPLSPALHREIEHAVSDSPLISFHSGFLADEDIQHYMAAADAVVFPYTKALTSGALILAMSFGRACIAPATGAISDTLDAEGGFLYDPSDPNALRQALAAAVEQRGALRRMGGHNRVRVQQWSWQEAGRRTALIYQACLSESA